MTPAVSAAARAALLPAVLVGVASGAVSDYRIDLSEIQSGRLEVTVETSCEAAECVFRMPVWNATYQVRDFARFVTRFRAESLDGAPLAVRKSGPSTWTVGPPRDGRLRARYSVRADRSGPFGAFADAELVCLNLGQVLVYPTFARSKSFGLSFRGAPKGFKQALALERDGAGYRAPSYDRLIDTPVVLADFEETSFERDGKVVRIVAAGAGGRFSLGALRATAERIVDAGAELMGGLPFDSYLFAYVFSEETGGGMEYRDGALIFAPADCRDCGLTALTAHEFFHLWNVKRIRPASLEPIDFTRPNPSPSLWFAEGVTSAYAEYLKILANLASGADLPRRLERLINDYESRPAARTQSAEESSLEAWFERYPDYGDPARSVSYYLQGEIIAHLLDLAIRERTANRRSLDDVMRRLQAEYGAAGRPFDDARGLRDAVNKVAGADLSAEVDRLVRSSEAIDWDRYLGYAGYRLDVAEEPRVEVGLSLANPPGEGLLVSTTAAGGPAEAAGLRVADEIVAVDGRRPRGGAAEVLRQLERSAGRTVEVRVQRRGLILNLPLRPVRSAGRVFRIVEDDASTPERRAVRRGWLSRSVDGAPEPSSEQRRGRVGRGGRKNRPLRAGLGYTIGGTRDGIGTTSAREPKEVTDGQGVGVPYFRQSIVGRSVAYDRPDQPGGAVCLDPGRRRSRKTGRRQISSAGRIDRRAAARNDSVQSDSHRAGGGR